MNAEQRVETWRLLRGKGALWHRTSLTALTAILQDGEIRPNTDGRFHREHGVSDISYARHLGGVSLLDFDSETEARIEEHANKYTLIHAMPPQVIIELSRGSLEPSRLLLPAVMTEGTDPRLDTLPPEIRRARMYVPAVEAIHIGPISATAFTGFLLIARDDSGERLWQSFPLSAVDELHMTAKDWSTNSEAAKARRHARGDLTIAELLSREPVPVRQRTADEILQLRRELRETFGLNDRKQDETPE
jgi:hypothetical protein